MQQSLTDTEGPARLDIGIAGQTASGESLFVGVEAKVDEPFGSETVCERYQEAVEYLKSNPRSKAAARVEELLSRYLTDNDEPCESRFADVGYQLLNRLSRNRRFGRGHIRVLRYGLQDPLV